MRRRPISWISGLGQTIAALALLCQVLSVLLPLPDAGATRVIADAGVICHADGGAPARDPAPAHHPADCALCPVCLATALPALTSVPADVPPPALWCLDAPLPPAHAGPAPGVRRLAAQPRGPPVPV